MNEFIGGVALKKSFCEVDKVVFDGGVDEFLIVFGG